MPKFRIPSLVSSPFFWRCLHLPVILSPRLVAYHINIKGNTSGYCQTTSPVARRYVQKLQLYRHIDSSACVSSGDKFLQPIFHRQLFSHLWRGKFEASIVSTLPSHMATLSDEGLYNNILCQALRLG